MVEPRTYGESTKKAIIAEQGIANETKGNQSSKRDRDQPRDNYAGDNSNKKRVPTNPETSLQEPCPKYGRFHPMGRYCDGSPKTCNICGKLGYISYQCRSTNKFRAPVPTASRKSGKL